MFTDDNLKRLKEEMRTGKIDRVKLGALLARLKAAERVCLYVERWLVSVNPNTSIGEPLEAWRKAAGKL